MFLTFQIEMPASLARDLAIALDLATLALVAKEKNYLLALSGIFQAPRNGTNRSDDTALSVEANETGKVRNPRRSASDPIRP